MDQEMNERLEDPARLNGMHLQREIEMPLLPKVHPDKATLPEESSHFII